MQRMKLELSSFSYTIRDWPRKDNTGPDALTRVNLEKLRRFWLLAHCLPSENLPFCIDDVKNISSPWKACTELKQRVCSQRVYRKCL